MAIMKTGLDELNYQQLTRGHNIVTDGWASIPIHTPTPTPTHEHTQKVYKTLVFPHSDSIITNGPTDGRTDKVLNKDACPQRKGEGRSAIRRAIIPYIKVFFDYWNVTISSHRATIFITRDRAYQFPNVSGHFVLETTREQKLSRCSQEANLT